MSASTDPLRNPTDSLEMEHELQLATYRQCDGDQDDVSLSKPHQITEECHLARTWLNYSNFSLACANRQTPASTGLNQASW